MLTVANLFYKAFQLSNNPENIDIDELGKYASVIDKFTPKKDDFLIIAEVGKSLTIYLLEQQIDRGELDDFIKMYQDFSKWYLKTP